MIDVEVVDGEIAAVNGLPVEKVTIIGYGSQHTVLLVSTAEKHYLVEAGVSARGQYVEVLAELTELARESDEADEAEAHRRRRDGQDVHSPPLR